MVAYGCDPLTSDSAGILFQIPHSFIADEAKRLELSITLPAPVDYGVGVIFLAAATRPKRA